MRSRMALATGCAISSNSLSSRHRRGARVRRPPKDRKTCPEFNAASQNGRFGRRRCARQTIDSHLQNGVKVEGEPRRVLANPPRLVVREIIRRRRKIEGRRRAGKYAAREVVFRAVTRTEIPSRPVRRGIVGSGVRRYLGVLPGWAQTDLAAPQGAVKQSAFVGHTRAQAALRAS